MATSPRSRRGHDRPGERVFAVGLDGAGEAQHLGLVGAVAAATPVTTCSPLVSVPVLSNSTASMVRIRSRASRSLTRMPPRRHGGRDRDHERDRQPERVRAGDDEHRDRPLDGVVEVAEQRPHHERDDRAAAAT